MLRDLLERRLEYAAQDGERFLDAAQNARVVANAERYYRAMYYGSARLLEPARRAHVRHARSRCSRFYGPDAKRSSGSTTPTSATPRPPRWARGASSTSASSAARQFGDGAYLVGFGTDHGTVAAASNWDEPMQRMRVRPAHAESYERLCHDVGRARLLLPPARSRGAAAVRDELAARRGSSAPSASSTGPRPSSQSHYFHASLPHQFDEYVWFDETRGGRTRSRSPRAPSAELPETYPFGL